MDYFSGCITRKTGRLVQPVVQGNCLFSVMGQETCEYQMRRGKSTNIRSNVSDLTTSLSSSYPLDRFYIALFSAFWQTQCALVACDCSLSIARFLNIRRSGVLTVLFGCCMAGAT